MATVLWITNIPTPYRLPLYRELASLLEARGDRLEVFFLGYARSSRSWTVRPADMRGFDHRSAAESDLPAVAAALRAMHALRPAAVVLAWAMDAVALTLLGAARRRGIPCIVVSGETPESAANNPWPALRRMFRWPFFRMSTRFLTYGSRSSRYLLGCGVAPAKVMAGVNTVDVGFFARNADAARAEGQAAAMRDACRLPDSTGFAAHLLVVGYLHAEKGVDRAIALLDRPGLERAALHIVGSGPLENALRDMASRRGLASRVFFHGYRQLDEMPACYALADLLIFPSLNEVFGLVMVEAAAAGLPIVASARAGGAADVVEPGGSGFVADPDDDMFAEAVRTLVQDAGLRARMGARSRAIALERFGIERSAALALAAIDSAIDSAIAARRRR